MTAPERTSPDRPFVLFVNQGVIGGGAMMGHLAAEHALRLGAATRPDIDAQFVRLPEWGLAMRAVAHRAPFISRWNLDGQVSRWHAAEALRARRVVRGQLRHKRPAALHIDSHSAAFALTGLMTEIPTFPAVDVPVWEHETVLGRRQFGLGPSLSMERRVFRRAECVVAYHRWSAEAVLRACPEATVRVLHPGLDLKKFYPVRRDHREQRQILFVGGEFEAKGGDDLLAALEPYLGREVVVDAVTSATVPSRPGLRIHRLGVGDPRLVELYQQADLMCLPSHRDVGPWAILEALACGTPVVGSTVGAIPELLQDSAAGLCVAPRDRRQLRATIENVLFDEPRLQALAGNARRMLEADFDARRQAGKLFDLMQLPTPEVR